MKTYKKRLIARKRVSQNHPHIVAGRITLFLGQELKKEVIRLAAERGNSVSGLVRAMLTKWIKTGEL